FKNSVLFSQGDLDGIASAKDSDKRSALLKDALSLLDYSKLEKFAKEEVSDLNKSIANQKNTIVELGDPAADIENLNIEIKQYHQDIFNNEQALKSINATIVNKKSEVIDLEKSLSSDASDFTQKLNELSLNQEQI